MRLSEAGAAGDTENEVTVIIPTTSAVLKSDDWVGAIFVDSGGKAPKSVSLSV
jgi:hypothetical protein